MRVGYLSNFLHFLTMQKVLLFSSSSLPVSGTDYIYMNSAVYRNGTSFVESLFETFGEFEFQHGAVKYTSMSTYKLP